MTNKVIWIGNPGGCPGEWSQDRRPILRVLLVSVDGRRPVSKPLSCKHHRR